MLKKLTKQIIIISIAIAIMTISINLFLSPHNIAAGGVSGIGILVENHIGLNRAIIVLILNSIMLVLAYLFLGKGIFVKSAIGSFLLPLSLALVPERLIINNQIISIVLGSIIFAIAVAILYHNEASSGGTTIPPLILHKYSGINTAVGLLITDMLIVIFNIFIFGIRSFIFAAISLLITSVVMIYIEKNLICKDNTIKNI